MKSWSLILLVVLFGARGLGQSYTCTSAGRFRYQDSTCRAYYLCVYYNGAYVKSNYTCPSDFVFNPTAQNCSTSAECIDTTCNGLPAAPLNPKVPDPNGSNCNTYIWCVQAANGNRYPVVQTCPEGLYFNNALLPQPDCSTTPNCV